MASAQENHSLRLQRLRAACGDVVVEYVRSLTGCADGRVGADHAVDVEAVILSAFDNQVVGGRNIHNDVCGAGPEHCQGHKAIVAL